MYNLNGMSWISNTKNQEENSTDVYLMSCIASTKKSRIILAMKVLIGKENVFQSDEILVTSWLVHFPVVINGIPKSMMVVSY